MIDVGFLQATAGKISYYFKTAAFIVFSQGHKYSQLVK